MTNRGSGPTAVVAREFNDDYVPLRNAWIGKLRDEKDIARAIGKISKTLPSMSHLKRCSSKRLVLGFAPPNIVEACDDRIADNAIVDLTPGHLSREDLDRLLIDANFDISLFENKNIFIVEVPAVAPRTRAQAKRGSKIWPLNFHPDPIVESILDGSCFNADDHATIDRCARLCIEAAKRGNTRGTDECNGSAIVLDPIANKIIAIAASRTDLHPMWHASVIAIDLVAKLSPGGGAYEFTNDARSLAGKSKWRRLTSEHGVNFFPLCYPTDLVDVAREFSYNVPPETVYLCTGYWVFLLREPCSICAMALLHSRVSNVFYGIANERHGVLGSRALLHVIPGLNHRYRVWKDIRMDECRSIFNEISRYAKFPDDATST